MARTIKEEEYTLKRNEIIAVAQRLIYTKGYEQMSIRDILDELKISKGAFYHYFDSKQALLEALIERLQTEGEQILQQIAAAPTLNTLEKLQRFFDVMGRWKTDNKGYLLEILRLWYAEHNALMRQKVQEVLVNYTTPIISDLIREGVREGLLHTPFPDQAGKIFFSLFLGLGDAFARLLFSSAPREQACMQAQALVAAYNDALERVLGAPPHSLHIMDDQTVREWFV